MKSKMRFRYPFYIVCDGGEGYGHYLRMRWPLYRPKKVNFDCLIGTREDLSEAYRKWAESLKLQAETFESVHAWWPDVTPREVIHHQWIEDADAAGMNQNHVLYRAAENDLHKDMPIKYAADVEPISE